LAEFQSDPLLRRAIAVFAIAAILVVSWPGVGATSLDEARSLHIAGELVEALRAYDEVAIALEPTDPASAASARNNSCVIYMNRGEHRAAVEQCRDALRLRQMVDDPRKLGRTLNNLGLALQYVGESDEASVHFGEALSINESIGDVEAQVINHANLGVLATQAGRYSAALASHGRALTLSEENPDAAWSAAQARVARVNQAVVLERLGAYREALEIYRQVVKESDEMDPHRRATLMANVGVVYRNLGDPVQAVGMFERAEQTFERLGDRAARANAFVNLGLVYHLNLAQPDEAETAYRMALDLARTSGDRAEEIQALCYFGRLLLDLGRVDEAGNAFENARAAATDSGSSEGLWQADDGLGRVASAKGDFQEALLRFEAAVDTIETVRTDLESDAFRSEWFGEKRSVYAAAVATLATLEQQRPREGFAERALGFVQRAKARSLLEALGGEGRRVGPLDAEAIASRVGSGLLVEYFVGERSLYAWTVHDGTVRLTDLGPAAPLLDAVSQVHADLSAGREPSEATVQTLSLTLVEKPGLPARFDALLVAPDGKLWYLPFELLHGPGEAASRLIDRATVSYLPSASTLGSLVPTMGSESLAAAGIGAPEIGETEGSYLTAAALLVARFELGELPGAMEELTMIERRMPGPLELRSGPEATEEAFAELMQRGSRVLHLATHTVVDERRRGGSAILLSPTADTDGLLYPAEISSVDGRLGLAVLSACRSALGPGEGSDALLSLTGAFLAAGSAAVVATLWDVDDAATRVFMDQFYEQLARGRAPADALRRAKLRFADDPRWASSSLWAGYVLVGEAEPVVSASNVRVWFLVVAMALGIATLFLFARRIRSRQG